MNMSIDPEVNSTSGVIKSSDRSGEDVVSLRRIHYDDRDLIFQWRNSPFLIRNSTSGKPVSREEHTRWFETIYKNESARCYIIQHRQEPIGQIRFERVEGRQCQVTIYLLEKYTGHGLGLQALETGMGMIIKEWGGLDLIAHVRADNRASCSVFKKAGFEEIVIPPGTLAGHKSFLYRPDKDFTKGYDLSSLVVFYEKKIKEHGDSFRSVAWGSQASQEKRFSVLCQVGDLAGKKILDVGCGLGDFYGWIITNGIRLNYEGVDITPSMIEQARKKYPKARFRLENILGNAGKEACFDYVFSSGIFNRRIDSHEQFIHRMIERMFDLSREALAFNIMSIRADFMEQDEYYADPQELLAYCRSLSPRVVINHEYMPHDFTVFMYHDKG